MTERTEKLRRQSLETPPSITGERAQLITEFYRQHDGCYSPAVMRARAFYYLCQHRSIYIGADELIVGERGPRPKATPTFPELTCHSLEDLRILNTRPKTWYRVEENCFKLYEEQIIPYWQGRSMRDRMFTQLPAQWKAAYDAGIFTEFMEQRAPGHTVLDDKIYSRGMLDFKRDIAAGIARLDFLRNNDAYERREALKSFEIACDALMLLGARHAQRARELAASEPSQERCLELLRIAQVCDHVPAHAPRDFHEALQYYWFCHLGVITELNGWDSFNPGHLDQHLLPFYQRGLADGRLTPESARELLECFFIKFNNHPAPPKVGVTAAESGTYTDFANINLGGLRRDGTDGSNELTHVLLDIVEEMHLLQPSTNVQLSRQSPDALLQHALRVVRHGFGFPSFFNADTVVAEQLRQGKTIEDARAGGCSGCVEVGAFGKEAFILTGYFNLPKVLELTLHDGRDPRTGQQLGPHTGTPEKMGDFGDVWAAFQTQLQHFLDVKIAGSRLIERMYATDMPAPFLSVLIDDCILKARDYNAGGARYNNTFIQLVGLGTITDSLSALKQFCFEEAPAVARPEPVLCAVAAAHASEAGSNESFSKPPPPSSAAHAGPAIKNGRGLSLAEMVSIVDRDFAGEEILRQRLLNRTHKYGNNDQYADGLMLQVFKACFDAVDGRPDTRGGEFRIEWLPTTCHIYFGSVTGALPDGRKAGLPLSEGISPVQGADRRGPTAVLRSAGQMEHVKTGGTLLNLKFTPGLVANEDGLEKWGHLVRTYFNLGGHHVQFNVVRAETLREAQARPESHRDLIVRVAGYSDYFCDLASELQNEIITRTEHQGF